MITHILTRSSPGSSWPYSWLCGKTRMLGDIYMDSTEYRGGDENHLRQSEGWCTKCVGRYPLWRLAQTDLEGTSDSEEHGTLQDAYNRGRAITL